MKIWIETLWWYEWWEANPNLLVDVVGNIQMWANYGVVEFFFINIGLVVLWDLNL